MLTKVRCFEYNYDSAEWSSGIRLPIMENYASFGLIFAQQNNYNWIDPYMLYSSMVGETKDNFDDFYSIQSSPMPSNRYIWDVMDMLPRSSSSYFDLSDGEIYIEFKRNHYIVGMMFDKSSFTEKTTLKIQLNNWMDDSQYNIGYTTFKQSGYWKWINPDGSDPSQPFQVTIDPADMDDGGCIYFTQPSDPSKPLTFIASSLKIRGVSGQLSNLLFDFVGTSIDYWGANGVMQKSSNHFLSTSATDWLVANMYYTGIIEQKFTKT